MLVLKVKTERTKTKLLVKEHKLRRTMKEQIFQAKLNTGVFQNFKCMDDDNELHAGSFTIEKFMPDADLDVRLFMTWGKQTKHMTNCMWPALSTRGVHFKNDFKEDSKCLKYPNKVTESYESYGEGENK